MLVIIFTQTAYNGQQKSKDKITLYRGRYTRLFNVAAVGDAAAVAAYLSFLHLTRCTMLCAVFVLPSSSSSSSPSSPSLDVAVIVLVAMMSLLFMIVHNEECKRDIFRIINCTACAQQRKQSDTSSHPSRVRFVIFFCSSYFTL